MDYQRGSANTIGYYFQKQISCELDQLFPLLENIKTTLHMNLNNPKDWEVAKSKKQIGAPQEDLHSAFKGTKTWLCLEQPLVRVLTWKTSRGNSLRTGQALAASVVDY